MAVYGSSSVVTTLLGELARAFPALAPWAYLRHRALCASVMIVFTHLAFRHRRQVPAPSDSRDRRDIARESGRPARGRRTARRAIATPTGSPAGLPRAGSQGGRTGHEAGNGRVSAEQTHHPATGEKNFNQLLNRHRVAHACRLLARPAGFENILHVSSESGFASLGPFNRAFKSMMGCTPTEYRVASLKGSAEAGCHELHVG